MERPDAVLIAGPTASGKSKHALELAKRWNGEIVNADSMQIYPVLDILTARPDADDLTEVPHHLYGYAPIAEPYSVAKWLADARACANDLWEEGKIPIFVGGTGLYFRALDEGLAGTPEIPADIRASIRNDLIENGSETLHQRLAALAPLEAERLRPTDGQRIARSLEVVTATGKPLSHFQNAPMAPAIMAGKNVERIVLMPQRQLIHERINARSEIMFEQGAIAEVEQLLALNLPSEATVLKAIGVVAIGKFIRGEQSLNETKNQIKAATRQYAKRQSTWFNGQFGSKWTFIDPFC